MGLDALEGSETRKAHQTWPLMRGMKLLAFFSRMDQPPLQYLILSGDNGASQPVFGVSTQIAKGMVCINRQKAITSSAKPVPGA